MNEIKAVIFDWGGVLGGATGTVRRHAAEVFGVDEHSIAQAWADLLPPIQVSEISEKEFWTSLSKRIGKPLPKDWKKLLREPYEKHYALNQDVIEIARNLKEKGFKLGILSNTIETHQLPQKKELYGELFDVVFLSHRERLRKPDKQAYLKLAEKLGVKPDEMVHIDDEHEFVEAAKKAGLKGIHFTNAEELKRQLARMGIG